MQKGKKGMKKRKKKGKSKEKEEKRNLTWKKGKEINVKKYIVLQ